MSSPELVELERRVEGLSDELRDLALKVDGFSVLSTEVEALKGVTNAHAARLEHINKVVMALQVDIQRLTKKVETTAADNNRKLDEIQATTNRILEALKAG